MKFANWVNTFDEKQNNYFVGLAGYCVGIFDVEKAKKIISDMFDDIENMLMTENGFRKIPVLVSGLTNTGILKLGYEEADRRKWKTIGIAPEELFDGKTPLFDVTERIIVGKNFGDESETFIEKIDIFIGIGNGKQTLKESEMAKEKQIPVYIFELERTMEN